VSLSDLRYGLTGKPIAMSPTPAVASATRVRVRVIAAPRRPVARAPAPPSGSHVEVTRGTTSSTYEVGNYAR
jgi:hypothetical protein